MANAIRRRLTLVLVTGSEFTGGKFYARRTQRFLGTRVVLGRAALFSLSQLVPVAASAGIDLGAACSRGGCVLAGGSSGCPERVPSPPALFLSPFLCLLPPTSSSLHSPLSPCLLRSLLGLGVEPTGAWHVLDISGRRGLCVQLHACDPNPQTCVHV